MNEEEKKKNEAAFAEATRQYEAQMAADAKHVQDMLRPSLTLACYGLEGTPVDALNGKIFLFAAKAALIKDLWGRKL